MTNLEKRQLKIFFFVLVVTTFIMGFSLKAAYSLKENNLLNSLVLVQMLMPALSVIIAELITEGKENVMYKFNIMYIIFTLCNYLLAMVSIFLPIENQSFKYINAFVMLILLIVFIAFYFKAGKENREKKGYKFINGKKSFLIIFLFIILYIINLILSGTLYTLFLSSTGGKLPTDDMNMNSVNIIVSFILILPLFIVNAPFFFGEELGWRYFLQPKLQKLCGKRLGVFILGFIWGIWHIFISIYFYSPKTFKEQIFMQVIFTIALAIFMGYAYMKTENIWVPIIIHYLNNNIASVLTGGKLNNRVLHWDQVLISSAVVLIVYGIFIFSKEYSNSKSLKSDIVE